MALAESRGDDPWPEEDLDHAIRQIVSRAVSSEGVVDIFVTADSDELGSSIFSDEFLAEVYHVPHKRVKVVARGVWVV